MKNPVYFILSLLLMLALPGISAVKDSLGVEKKNGKTYIKHKIDPKETVYALSRKYGATVAEIKEANPGVDFASLNIGDIVLVPSKSAPAKSSATTKAAEPAKKEEVKKPQETTTQSAGSKTHKVQPKETLFSLSKKYNVTVDELKKANPELAAGLQVGMELAIPQKGGAVTTAAPKSGKTEKFVVEEAPSKKDADEDKPVKKEEPAKPVQEKPEAPAKTETAAAKPEPKPEAPVKKSEPAQVKAETTSSKPESVPVKKASAPAEIATSNSKIEKVKENGLAEQAPSRSDGPDFYALHKTAPVGTIIQVVNEENNQSAFVRVIGVSTSSSVIELSAKTLQRLNAKGEKVKVNLSYFKP